MQFHPISTQTGSVVAIYPEYSKTIVTAVDELSSLNLNGNLISDSSLPNSTDVGVFYFLWFILRTCSPLDRVREEKMKEKQKYQEEKLKAALERAVAQPKKKVCVLLLIHVGPTTSMWVLLWYENKMPNLSIQ